MMSSRRSNASNLPRPMGDTDLSMCYNVFMLIQPVFTWCCLQCQALRGSVETGVCLNWALHHGDFQKHFTFFSPCCLNCSKCSPWIWRATVVDLFRLVWTKMNVWALWILNWMLSDPRTIPLTSCSQVVPVLASSFCCGAFAIAMASRDLKHHPFIRKLHQALQEFKGERISIRALLIDVESISAERGCVRCSALMFAQSLSPKDNRSLAVVSKDCWCECD